MSECFLPVGTPDYIAPEVLEFSESRALEVITTDDADEANRRDSELAETPGYGPAIDWWSYGVTLYELAYGTAPFLMTTVRETYQRIIACGVSLGHLGRKRAALTIGSSTRMPHAMTPPWALI